MEKSYDVIILGGGPAGLTAGIYLSRAKYSVLIIDQGVIGGQVVMSHSIANYPGIPEISGYQFARAMRKQAKDFGCDIISSVEVSSMDITGDVKKIKVDDEDSYTSKAVIIATGGYPRSLNIPSENRFKGAGISYCATCDGDFFRDKNIVVIGGGNSALEEAVSLTQYAASVKIIHQFDHFQAYKHAVDEAMQNSKISFIMQSEVAEFTGDESLDGVLIKNVESGLTEKIEAEGAFIFIGYIPNSGQFQGIVKTNSSGEIETDEEMYTGLPGIFAAGDVRKKKIRQITTAVSDGTVAAISAIDYLRSI